MVPEGFSCHGRECMLTGTEHQSGTSHQQSSGKRRVSGARDKPVLAEAWGSKSLCGGLREELSPGRCRVVIMGKGDPNKQQGKMSFVQGCREERKKKHPDSSVNFAEFSKKCSERWKTMSAKEKTKFEDLAKNDKARYDREMKNYVPPKGDKTGKKTQMLRKDLRLPSFCFALNIAHRSKVNTLACLLEIPRRNWVRCGLSILPKINNRMSRKQLN